MVFYNKTNAIGKENPEALSDRAKAYLDKPVAELELSVRVMSVMKAAGINTVRELVSHTELDMLRYRNFGRKSLRELKDILSEMGLYFGMNWISRPAKSPSTMLGALLQRPLLLQRWFGNRRSKKAHHMDSRFRGNDKAHNLSFPRKRESMTEPSL